MTTLQNLIDRIQNQLADSAEATWPEATLEEWIETALAEYTQHFPRQRVTTISDTVDVQEYDLPADFLEAITVEFPVGEEPRRYLKRKPITDADFWTTTGNYDILTKREAIDPDQIFISDVPDGSQAIELVYLAQHDTAYATTDTLTIPRPHETIIEQYVIYLAWQERTSAEMANPTSNSSLLMAQLQANAAAAFRRYTETLNRAKKTAGGESKTAHWAPTGSTQERIY